MYKIFKRATAAVLAAAVAVTPFAGLTASADSRIISMTADTTFPFDTNGGTTYGRDYCEHVLGAPYAEFYDKLRDISEKMYAGEKVDVNKGNYKDGAEYTSVSVYESCNIDRNKVYQAYRIFMVDHPDNYFFDKYVTWSSKSAPNVITQLEIRLLPKYAKDSVRIAKKQLIEQTLEEYKAVAEEGTSRYDKVRVVYEYLRAEHDFATKGGKPSTADTAHSLLGVMSGAGGNAVCEGDAEAMMYILNSLGIPTLTFWGARKEYKLEVEYTPYNYESLMKKVNSVNALHQWNLIKMDDGKWYVVASTDPETTGGDKYNLHNRVDYDRFLIPESEFGYRPYVQFAHTYAYVTYTYPSVDLSAKRFVKTGFSWITDTASYPSPDYTFIAPLHADSGVRNDNYKFEVRKSDAPDAATGQFLRFKDSFDVLKTEAVKDTNYTRLFLHGVGSYRGITMTYTDGK